MSPRTRVVVASLVSAAALACAGGAVASGCAEDEHKRSDGGDVTGGCSIKAGEIPPPSCDNASNECATERACSIDEKKCGSASTCLPIADNKGKQVLDFRMRRLNVAAPKALAQQFIQKTVVTTNIDLNARECGEKGKGLFTWLLRVDRQNNTLVTGGAPPSADPFGVGYCFARFTTADKIVIEPLQTGIVFQGDTFKSTDKKKLNVPIFLNGDVNNVVVLPVTDVVIQGVALSEGGNCIGKLNPNALSSDCSDDPALCSKWQTAGALGGYITIEEADQVYIQDLSESLCVILTQSSKGPDGRCTRQNGKIAFEGDYCSKDKQPGSCKDSFWLAATFAASAVTIYDGNGKLPTCSGQSAVVDGGSDGASDATTDAPADATADAPSDATAD